MKIKSLTWFILFFVVAISSNAYGKRRGAMRSRPPELRGSREQRIAQNLKARDLVIPKIFTETELEALVRLGTLIELTDFDYYYIDPSPEKICTLNLKGKYKAKFITRHIYVYPAVKRYLELRASEYFTRFHAKLKLTSGARSLEEQLSMRTKGSPCFTKYAAEANDELEESLHVRGIAVDISRRVMVITNKKNKYRERQMSWQEIAWMRASLMKDIKLKTIEAEEEFPETLKGADIEPIEENICYHIVVFPKQ